MLVVDWMMAADEVMAAAVHVIGMMAVGVTMAVHGMMPWYETMRVLMRVPIMGRVSVPIELVSAREFRFQLHVGLGFQSQVGLGY